MKKTSFIKSVILLIFGGFISKIASMIKKIVMARYLGSEGMGIFALASPAFILFMALAQLGLPIAVSKLVAEETKNNKNLVFSIIPISLLFNITLMLLIIWVSPFISEVLLNEKRCYYALIAIALVLPFISISSILRGYFFGKQRMFPHVLSCVIEDVVRLTILIIGLPYVLQKGLEYAVAYTFLVNMFSELTSIFVLFFFLPKNFKITKKDLTPNKQNIKEVFSIGVPTTMSRLIGSFGSFLEPIILTFVLLKCGYDNKFIVNEYGVLNGFIMPLILLPSFFTMAISQALIPSISNAYSHGNKVYVRKRLRLAIFLSLLVGFPATLIFIFDPELPLSFIYGTTDGIEYIKILAPLFIFHYIQNPLNAALQAMGKATDAMNGTLQGTIIRIIAIFSLSFLHIGLWGLVFASAINVIYVTIHQYLKINKYLKN